jgi:(R,R)-butanediol dehydrogenase/meso-butanediol dehydrogenase/diacetyl reductase
MKALRWYGNKDLRYVDVPEPSPGAGQLKIKVSLAGICGSDLKEYAYGPNLIPPDKVPITIGHEFCGTVAEVGKGVKGFKPGDRVSGVGNTYCGECYVCKKGLYNLCVNQGFAGLFTDGCMAEYFVHEAYSCYKLPENVSDEKGALVEPLAVALHAVKQAHLKPGETVAVLGDGTIGLCCLLAAKAGGASKVYMIAKHKGRGGLALKLGATAVIYSNEGDPVKKLQELTGGIGTNAAIECVGRPETPQLAVELVQRGGIAVIVGIFEQKGMFDFSSITFTEKSMVGSSIYIDEGRTAIELKKGFDSLINDKEKNIKVLLRTS